MDSNEVFWTAEQGNCHSCGLTSHLLAGPSHSPRDGSAHYVCFNHLDPDAKVVPF